jgi:hypothetical protein
MHPIIIFEGAELLDLIAELRATLDRGPYRLRVAIDEGGFKIKANEGVWSPPYGQVEATRPQPPIN